MKSGRTQNAISNISMNFLNQIIGIILSFISRSIFIRVLGVDLLGINGLFSDLLNLLSMADLGFTTAMSYSFYKPIAENDTIKISSLIGFYKKIYRIIAFTITVIGILIMPFLRFIVNTDKEIPLLNLYYLFSLAGVVISYLFVYKTAILVASQKNYVIARITMIINTIKTIIQIVTLIVFKNYILYLTINLLSNFITNYLASKKAIILYPYINDKSNLNLEEKRNIFINLKSIFLYKISSLLLNATDNTLISIIVGTAAVGYYSNYLMLSTQLTSFMQIIFSSLTASIGNLILKEKSDRRYEVFKITQSISFIICGIIITGFIVTVNDLIRIWLGSEFLLENSIVIAIAINMYLACVLQPLWTYREASGLYIKTKYIMLVAAIINLILSLVLGNVVGLVGILLASAIARLSTYFWYEPVLLFKDYFNKSVKNYYIPISFNMFAICFINFIFIKIFSNFKVFSVGTLILKIILCGLISTIIFISIYYNSDGIKLIRNRFKKKFFVFRYRNDAL
ncbi:lipopolysaccharide biosynthesis protein [Clostridium perfringens]|uniref:lipopolysaccharide biosynthesis protein n=1 Tax=Clostridium perfringens TaxID=1502 RepID=UPI001A2A69BC|nr:oligosaccharide flippase family protein [Clostridium perfringens]UBK74358.1 oligosaccharide flippase family protein [Clostridium perfringens]HAT4072070.1 oligosaccharide flippase family protein [Clostridium perfringens]HAT4073163.1 oligosaccharide flippase family protein [Clostridium perfringens]HAT4143113.1 oligosaccharide flippase family protein [Clostridium perfringens]HAT4146245.1 oligosaccharide flippase family protein [Clostridium perfringens]